MFSFTRGLGSLVRYKYIEKQYADALIESGCIKIGTADGYGQEGGKMVMDKDERTSTIKFGAAKISQAEQHKYPGLKALGDLSGVKNLEFGGNSRIEIICPNFYVFCTATEYSAESHQKWNDEEGYDSCYMITDIMQFAKDITDELAKHVPVGIPHSCEIEYYDQETGLKLEDPRCNLDPWALKNSVSYDDQCEHRAIWLPKDRSQPIEPMILNVPSLAKLVKKIDYRV